MERPILFSGEMVKAILAGRKTQTRRVIKPQPDDGPWPNAASHIEWHDLLTDTDYYVACGHCPYGKIGDHLWVRESWLRIGASTEVWYKADGVFLEGRTTWRPSIHMPRWASRIKLEITGIRVERVQAISENDARAEGITSHTDNLGSKRSNPTRIYPAFPEKDGGFLTARAAFECLWDSINAKRGYGWDRDPWVWVIEFRVGGLINR